MDCLNNSGPFVRGQRLRLASLLVAFLVDYAADCFAPQGVIGDVGGTIVSHASICYKASKGPVIWLQKRTDERMSLNEYLAKISDSHNPEIEMWFEPEIAINFEREIAIKV
jgi:hypothetical protein